MQECEAQQVIANLKWADRYRCRKCGNEKYIEGRTPYSRRCSRYDCKYDESAIKDTAIEELRIPVWMALEAIRLISVSAKRIVSSDFVRHLETTHGVTLRTATASKLLEKLSDAWPPMLKLKGEVTVASYDFGYLHMLVAKEHDNTKEYRIAKTSWSSDKKATVQTFIERSVSPGADVHVLHCNRDFAWLQNPNVPDRKDTATKLEPELLVIMREVWPWVEGLHSKRHYAVQQVQRALNLFCVYSNGVAYQELLKQTTFLTSARKLQEMNTS